MHLSTAIRSVSSHRLIDITVLALRQVAFELNVKILKDFCNTFCPLPYKMSLGVFCHEG